MGKRAQPNESRRVARSEALPRDIGSGKSHRWGFGLRYARCNTAKRLEILLLLGTLATLVAWLIGLAGRTLQWNWQLQANTTRKREVLSTFFIGRQLLIRPALEVPPRILQLAFAALQRDLIAAADV